MAETEENKTEEPTPHKLKRAREKGQVARGTDLGFFSVLAGLSLFAVIAGDSAMRTIAGAMRNVFAGSIRAATDPQQAPAAIASAYFPLVQIVAVFGLAVAAIVILFEIAQLRGPIFSTQPLKPDFGRLSPAKGLKRVFSMRMVKDTAKNILKFIVYSAIAWFVIVQMATTLGPSIIDAPSLAEALRNGFMRLLFLFLLAALAFAALDQIIARRDFLKQMRMSRSELTREFKEREGEPRIKRKRKQLHAEFAKQTRGLGELKGSDMLVVNPQHYAVALAYDARTMAAPRVTAKGRNNFALLLKRRAAQLSIPVFESPKLARALYRRCEPGQEVPGDEYRPVVELYLTLARHGRKEAGSNA